VEFGNVDCEYGVESWSIKCGVQKGGLGNLERKIKNHIINIIEKYLLIFFEINKYKKNKLYLDFFI
jgi:hypothetical protein